MNVSKEVWGCWQHWKKYRMPDYPFTKKEFDSIYSRVPRLNVEVIVKTDEGVAMTLRSIEPSIGLWHLPGGTVYYGEPIEESVKRVAKKEIGITVLETKMLGIIEYPEHVKSGYGDPRGIAYLITKFDGDFVIDKEADKIEFFDTVPELMHPHQGEFLVEHGIIKG